MRKQEKPQVRSNSPYDAFSRFAWLAAGAGGVASLGIGSVIPLLIAGVGIFCVLCFTNGLWR